MKFPYMKIKWGDTVAQGLALLPHSKKVAGSRLGLGCGTRLGPGSGTFLCGVCMFSLCLRGLFTGYSGFLPQSKNMLRLIGDSKLPVGVNV